jgi:hypothetical protein
VRWSKKATKHVIFSDVSDDAGERHLLNNAYEPGPADYEIFTVVRLLE